jgi:hypothetical protein
MSAAPPSPYSTPSAPLIEKEEAATRSRLLLVAAWGALLLLAALAGLAAWAVGLYGWMFGDLNMPLSARARVVLELRYLWCAFPLLALQVAARAQRRGLQTAVYRRKVAQQLMALLALAFAVAVVAYLILSTQSYHPDDGTTAPERISFGIPARIP